ncbi:MAG: smalltalk protein [Prevotella sp.]|nr:smalltalk protein [Prevotella sp.]
MKNAQRNGWTLLLKVLIAIGSALLGVLGGAEACSLMMS